MICGYCLFSAPFEEVQALLVVNGQSVCRNHVDEAELEFGRSLLRLQQDREAR